MLRACLACAALLGLSSSACGDDGTPLADGGPADAGGRDAGPPGRPDAGPFTRIPEAEAAAGRASCLFERGAMPWDTVGEEFPIGDALPFAHLIIVMQENRSFDHYFGAMPGVEGPPADASNPDSTGAPVAPFHETRLCINDVRHGWNASHRQYNGGANDGFIYTNEPGGERALGYFTDEDIPFYWDLYGTFAMSDHHHCSVLGPTWVNRFYFTAGTSFGNISNGPIPDGRLPTDGSAYVIYQQLDEFNVDWALYNSDVPTIFGLYPGYAGSHIREIRPLEAFWHHLEEGTLPAGTYLDPSFAEGVEQTDEHPPANPQAGQAFVRRVVESLFDSPLWEDTVLVITYDEHGGFYDHVPPPEACPPGDFPPDLGPSDESADYDRLGFRVPLVVVSPWSKAGYVSDHTTDLTSVLRLVQTRFLLPALTARDANAWPLLDMFDFDSPPFITPPTDLAEAVIDEAKMAECRRLYPGGGVGF